MTAVLSRPVLFCSVLLYSVLFCSALCMQTLVGLAAVWLEILRLKDHEGISLPGRLHVKLAPGQHFSLWAWVLADGPDANVYTRAPGGVNAPHTPGPPHQVAWQPSFGADGPMQGGHGMQHAQNAFGRSPTPMPHLQQLPQQQSGRPHAPMPDLQQLPQQLPRQAHQQQQPQWAQNMSGGQAAIWPSWQQQQQQQHSDPGDAVGAQDYQLQPAPGPGIGRGLSNTMKPPLRPGGRAPIGGRGAFAGRAPSHERGPPYQGASPHEAFNHQRPIPGPPLQAALTQEPAIQDRGRPGGVVGPIPSALKPPKARAHMGYAELLKLSLEKTASPIPCQRVIDTDHIKRQRQVTCHNQPAPQTAPQNASLGASDVSQAQAGQKATSVQGANQHGSLGGNPGGNPGPLPNENIPAANGGSSEQQRLSHSNTSAATQSNEVQRSIRPAGGTKQVGADKPPGKNMSAAAKLKAKLLGNKSQPAEVSMLHLDKPPVLQISLEMHHDNLKGRVEAQRTPTLFLPSESLMRVHTDLQYMP